MSITDELREFASHCAGGMGGDSLRHIADRIDAEHESACAEAYGNGVQSVALPDLTAYVKVPVDAEGKPIRIGDVMEWCDSGETLTVEGIGGDVLFYIDGENAEWTAARNKRHHHAPTVEDVLTEFAEKITDSQIPGMHPTYEEAIAEYAAKLRLSGGDAE